MEKTFIKSTKINDSKNDKELNNVDNFKFEDKKNDTDVNERFNDRFQRESSNNHHKYLEIESKNSSNFSSLQKKRKNSINTSEIYNHDIDNNNNKNRKKEQKNINQMNNNNRGTLLIKEKNKESSNESSIQKISNNKNSISNGNLCKNEGKENKDINFINTSTNNFKNKAIHKEKENNSNFESIFTKFEGTSKSNINNDNSNLFNNSNQTNQTPSLINNNYNNSILRDNIYTGNFSNINQSNTTSTTNMSKQKYQDSNNSNNDYIKDIFGNTQFLIPIKNYNNSFDKTQNHCLTNLKLPEVNNLVETEDIYYIELMEKLYNNLNPCYFDNSQPQLHPWMRTMLLDWIMNLCSQLAFKRATFHLAIVLIDISLSKIDNIHQSKLQLVGVVCLIIAAKYEEICCPTLNMFAFTTENAFSSSEIIHYEQKILQKLDWKISFPNFTLWANLITLKWDQWLKTQVDKGRFRNLPFFRFHFSNPYMFQRYFYCIDLAILYPDSLFFQFKAFEFMSSLLYIIIGYFSMQIPENVISGIYSGNDISGLDNYYISHVIDMFLNESMNTCLHDVAMYVPLACHFFTLTGKDLEVNRINSFEEDRQVNIFFKTKYFEYLIFIYFLKQIEYFRRISSNANLF